MPDNFSNPEVQILRPVSTVPTGPATNEADGDDMIQLSDVLLLPSRKRALTVLSLADPARPAPIGEFGPPLGDRDGQFILRNSFLYYAGRRFAQEA